jgi:hypothetical protein
VVLKYYNISGLIEIPDEVLKFTNLTELSIRQNRYIVVGQAASLFRRTQSSSFVHTKLELCVRRNRLLRPSFASAKTGLAC